MGQQLLMLNIIVSTYEVSNLVAYNLACEWHEDADITRACLEKIARWMKKCTDTKRYPVEYSMDNMVMIKL